MHIVPAGHIVEQLQVIGMPPIIAGIMFIGHILAMDMPIVFIVCIVCVPQHIC